MLFIHEDFITIPAIFYVVVAIVGLKLPDLRKSRWIFDMGASAHEPWFKFYTLLHFKKVKYTVLWSTLPTQFALLVSFFCRYKIPLS
jgi:SulP family sulfate permease